MRRLVGDDEVDLVTKLYSNFINHTGLTQIPILLTNPSVESLSMSVGWEVLRVSTNIYNHRGSVKGPLDTLIQKVHSTATVNAQEGKTTNTIQGVHMAGNQGGANAFNGMNTYVMNGSESLVFASKVTDDTYHDIDYPYIIFPGSNKTKIKLPEGGETQYMFVSSDRFVMTVQQPGNVYIDSLTKIIMCCIYPKVHKLVYNDYFLEGSLAYPIKLLCYSFMINWGA